MTCAHCGAPIEYRYKAGVGYAWAHTTGSIYCARVELVHNGESKVARPLSPRGRW